MKPPIVLMVLLLFCTAIAAQKKRARDLGIPFDGTTGKYNAITDVKGVGAACRMTPK